MYIVQGEGQLPFWQPLPARAQSRVDAALKNTSPPPRAALIILGSVARPFYSTGHAATDIKLFDQIERSDLV